MKRQHKKMINICQKVSSVTPDVTLRDLAAFVIWGRIIFHFEEIIFCLPSPEESYFLLHNLVRPQLKRTTNFFKISSLVWVLQTIFFLNLSTTWVVKPKTINLSWWTDNFWVNIQLNRESGTWKALYFFQFRFLESLPYVSWANPSGSATW